MGLLGVVLNGQNDNAGPGSEPAVIGNSFYFGSV